MTETERHILTAARCCEYWLTEAVDSSIRDHFGESQARVDIEHCRVMAANCSAEAFKLARELTH